MSDALSVRLDAAFVLAITGAAMLSPWLAPLVAAAFLLGNAVLIDRRTPPQATE